MTTRPKQTGAMAAKEGASAAVSKAGPLLEIRDLSIELRTRTGSFVLVEDINLSIAPGEVFGIVGESGCGKSVTAYSVAGLLSTPPLHVASGAVLFEGRNLLELSPREMRQVRGRDIGMIFQEPMTALDPLFTIGSQIAEALEFHSAASPAEAAGRSVDMLRKVGIPRPERIAQEYPHRLSGGMLQRVVIAMAMINRPKLLIADEPTTALDVTIQAQILDLMNELVRHEDMAMIMITHDLGVVAETCERVAVFYGGHIVELAGVDELFSSPRHPYTEGLCRSITTLGEGRETLYSIPGTVPSAGKFGDGCRFRERCEKRMPICAQKVPPLLTEEDGRSCRCWLRGEGA